MENNKQDNGRDYAGEIRKQAEAFRRLMWQLDTYVSELETTKTVVLEDRAKQDELDRIADNIRKVILAFVAKQLGLATTLDEWKFELDEIEWRRKYGK